jgi:hypothetical protein
MSSVSTNSTLLRAEVVAACPLVIAIGLTPGAASEAAVRHARSATTQIRRAPGGSFVLIANLLGLGMRTTGIICSPCNLQ